jgi:hypothetical protein
LQYYSTCAETGLKSAAGEALIFASHTKYGNRISAEIATLNNPVIFASGSILPKSRL